MQNKRPLYICLGCVAATLLIAAVLFWKGQDNSRTLDSRGAYSLWEVPITQNLARSMQNCTFYKRTYRDPILYQLWNNRLGHQDILTIRPGLQDTCVLTYQTGSWFSPLITTETKTTVPKALAHRVGTILLQTFQNTPADQQDVKEFAQCIAGYDLFKDEDIFAAGMFEIFTHTVEEYLEEQDVSRYALQQQRPAREQDQEEKRCLQIQQNLTRILASHPEFKDLTNEEKMALAGKALPAQYGVTLGGGGGSAGYNPRKNEGKLGVHSAVSRCDIRYNPSGIISAKFTREEKPSWYRLPAKCW